MHLGKLCIRIAGCDHFLEALGSMMSGTGRTAAMFPSPRAVGFLQRVRRVGWTIPLEPSVALVL